METGVILALIFILAATAFFASYLNVMRRRRQTRVEADWEEILADSGYIYDRKQNIFYSAIDAWQRNYGYSKLYDEAAAPMSLIIDCEPIYFNYGGKNWLIELWKGQYGMTTGCEVGVYNTEGPVQYFPNGFNYTLDNCASEPDHLQMSLTLYKNGRSLFSRSGVHWWLTGFVLGEFSEPSELVMELTISLKDREMLMAFTNSLRGLGYTNREVRVSGNNVGILFSTPHSEQPNTRTELISRLSQMKNKYLCERYQEVTEGAENIDEAIEAVRQKAPELFKLIGNIGRPASLFKDTGAMAN